MAVIFVEGLNKALFLNFGRLAADGAFTVLSLKYLCEV